MPFSSCTLYLSLLCMNSSTGAAPVTTTFLISAGSATFGSTLTFLGGDGDGDDYTLLRLVRGAVAGTTAVSFLAAGESPFLVSFLVAFFVSFLVSFLTGGEGDSSFFALAATFLMLTQPFTRSSPLPYHPSWIWMIE